MTVKVETNELPGSKVEVQVTADPEDMRNIFAKTYQRLAQQGQVPGFRPGKAPAAVIKRQYPQDVIRRLAWGLFVEDIYVPALENSRLRPLAGPQFPDLDEVENFAEGETVEVKTVLTVHPRPKLPDYKSLKLLRPDTEVSDEDVQQQLEQLREAYAEEIEVDRDSVAEGDVVQAEVQVCRADTEEVIEETTARFIADRDSDQPVARKLSGHMVGQTVTDETTIAEGHADEELAGQTVIVKATIKEIKQRQLPELDDEFAGQVDEELESLEALRDRIREQLTRSREAAGDEAARNMAMNVVAAATDIDLPEELVNSVTADQVESYMQYLQQEGVSTEQTLEAVQQDEEGVVSEAAYRAQQGLKLHYIFQEIAELEELEIADEDLDDAVGSYAQDNNLDEQMVRQAIQLHEEVADQVRDYARRHQVMQLLVDNAEIEQVPWDGFAVRMRKHIEEYPEQLRQTRKELAEPAEGSASDAQPAVAPTDTQEDEQ